MRIPTPRVGDLCGAAVAHSLLLMPNPEMDSRLPANSNRQRIEPSAERIALKWATTRTELFQPDLRIVGEAAWPLLRLGRTAK
jgi:hypothetical protein